MGLDRCEKRTACEVLRLEDNGLGDAGAVGVLRLPLEDETTGRIRRTSVEGSPPPPLLISGHRPLPLLTVSVRRSDLLGGGGAKEKFPKTNLRQCAIGLQLKGSPSCLGFLRLDNSQAHSSGASSPSQLLVGASPGLQSGG